MAPTAKQKQGNQLNNPSNQWANPWHKKPPAWKNLRPSQATEADVADSKKIHTDHQAATRTTLEAQIKRMDRQGEGEGEERKEYGRQNFLGRAMWDSTPHLRAPASPEPEPAPEPEPEPSDEGGGPGGGDGEGVIDEAEAIKAAIDEAAETVMAACDADGDGFLTKEEMMANSTTSADADALIAEMDADGDGKISKDEVVGALTEAIAASASVSEAEADSAVTEPAATPADAGAADEADGAVTGEGVPIAPQGEAEEAQAAAPADEGDEVAVAVAVAEPAEPAAEDGGTAIEAVDTAAAPAAAASAADTPADTPADAPAADVQGDKATPVAEEANCEAIPAASEKPTADKAEEPTAEEVPAAADAEAAQ